MAKRLRKLENGRPVRRVTKRLGRPPGSCGRHDVIDREFFESWGNLLFEMPDVAWPFLGRSMMDDPHVTKGATKKRLQARWGRDGEQVWRVHEARVRHRQEIKAMIDALPADDQRWLADELLPYSSLPVFSD